MSKEGYLRVFKAGLIVLAVSILLQSGCGYNLVGRGGSFPQGVEKIAVLPFRNRTDRFGLEGEASSIFIQEIMATGKVKIADMESADAWFEGTLTEYNTNPIAFTVQREILERRLTITARIDFFLKNGKEPFFSEKGLKGTAEYPVSGNLSEDSQAEREAESRALEELAAGVISRIIEGF